MASGLQGLREAWYSNAEPDVQFQMAAAADPSKLALFKQLHREFSNWAQAESVRTGGSRAYLNEWKKREDAYWQQIAGSGAPSMAGGGDIMAGRTSKAKLKPRIPIGIPFSPAPVPPPQVQQALPPNAPGVNADEPVDIVGKNTGKVYAHAGDSPLGKETIAVIPPKAPSMAEGGTILAGNKPSMKPDGDQPSDSPQYEDEVRRNTRLHPDLEGGLDNLIELLMTKTRDENTTRDGPPANADGMKLGKWGAGRDTEPTGPMEFRPGTFEPGYYNFMKNKHGETRPDPKVPSFAGGGFAAVGIGGATSGAEDDPIARALRQRRETLNAQRDVPANEEYAKVDTLTNQANQAYGRYGLVTPTGINVPQGAAGPTSPLSRANVRPPVDYVNEAHDLENLNADQNEYNRQGGQVAVPRAAAPPPTRRGDGGGVASMFGGGGSGGGSASSQGSAQYGHLDDGSLGYTGGGTEIMQDPTTGQSVRVNREDAAKTRLSLANKPNELEAEQQRNDAQSASLNGLVPYRDPYNPQGRPEYITPAEAKIRGARDSQRLQADIDARFPKPVDEFKSYAPDELVDVLLEPEKYQAAFGGDKANVVNTVYQIFGDKGFSHRAVDVLLQRAQIAAQKKKDANEPDPEIAKALADAAAKKKAGSGTVNNSDLSAGNLFQGLR